MDPQTFLESAKYYAMISSIQGAGLLGAINLFGFVCSVENIKNSYVTRTQEESIYNWSMLDKAMGAISKPGRSLAYLVFNKK